MSSGLIELMKIAAMDAMDNNQMCDLRFGKVTSTKPLKVQVSSQLTIPESLLIVPMHLTDYKIRVNFDWDTETDGGDHSHLAFDSNGPAGVDLPTTQYELTKHHHQILSENDNSRTKTITMLSHLHIGEKVALLRKQGGQCYYILDRVDTEKEIEEIK
jgi:hypothetical protein